MRIKLFIKNIKSHFIISILLCISLSFFMAILLMKLEYTHFMINYNLEEYIYEHNGFDIVIQSTSGISTYGSKEFRDQYEKCASFYQVAVVGDANGKSQVINVFEGKTDSNDEKYNYQNAFSFDSAMQSHQTIITQDLAKTLNLSINDKITLHIGDSVYTYEVIKIVDNEGLFSKNSMLITGTTISKAFAYLSTMSNIIFIKVNDINHLDTIYQKLNMAYESYHVTNVRDREYLKSLVSTDANVYIMMAVFILFGLFLFIRKIYQKKLNKQSRFISSYNKVYYQEYVFLARCILFVVSYLLSLMIVQLYFSFTASFYSHPFRYFIHIKNCFLLLCVCIGIYFLLSMKINLKNYSNKKVYMFVILGILIVMEILAILFHHKALLGIISILLAFIAICVLMILVFPFLKKIKSLLKRFYTYDLNRHSILDKLMIIMYIIIACFFSIIITSMTSYHKSIEEMDQLINIQTLVVTNKEEKLSYDKIGVYDCIKMNDGMKDLTIDTILGLDANQVGKYTGVSLTDDELEQYGNQDSIILSVYFRNKLNCQIGDEIQVKLPETDEYKNYRIIKFIDTIYWKFAIMSKNDAMMNGYIISDDVEGLKNNLNRTTYNVIDVKKQIMNIKAFYQTNLQQVAIVLIFIMMIFIFFLFYLSYVDLESKKESIKKLKKLGLSNKKLIGMNRFKMIIDMLTSFILSILFSSIVVYFFDDIALIFHTTFFIRYHLNIIVRSSLLMLVCICLGTLYTNYVISKEKI